MKAVKSFPRARALYGPTVTALKETLCDRWLGVDFFLLVSIRPAQHKTNHLGEDPGL